MMRNRLLEVLFDETLVQLDEILRAPSPFLTSSLPCPPELSLPSEAPRWLDKAIPVSGQLWDFLLEK